MAPWCWTRACGQGPQEPQTSGHSHACAPLLLLLLLLRAEGCLGVGGAQGALSTAAPADPGVPCTPKATSPSGGPRLPRQAPTVQALTSTIQLESPVSNDFLPCEYSCGYSYEQDPTLRDPEAMARRWPWMASVRANGTHICAGTIIASRWVLTVAHCLTQSDVLYSVRVGSPWIDQMTQTTSDIPVLQVIVNSRYRSRRYWSWVGRANNIGLLKLEWVLSYNKYVWPVCLPGLDYVLKDSSLCTVTGWGLPKVDGEWPQFRTIQEKEVTILNNKECDSLYHKFSRIPSVVRIINSQMICAEDTNREHFCYEITGEPLVCPSEGVWYLVGMVSWGAGCNQSEAPPIYLRVSSYQHWIRDRRNGQPLALLAPSRTLLLALPLPLSLLAAP
ncbi:PREDICTED: probable threonine protease PRSS50 [Galeopterus variegatus]|uniref:Probable threonine protease PRSS50 n=1 Tax=Galeopterus variegatus TaxID=482537 RepID=A0ABM0QU39_GALVR|nr:PREDICTED: probable threonine protease PRSS50 [Galeopterus variegatus]